jgi:hypothetical protein
VAKGFKSGGRRAGTPNRATLERQARARAGIEAALAAGLMPLDVILTVMRGGPAAAAISERQYQAACAAVPFLHPKLSSTALDATLRAAAAAAALTDDQLAAIARAGGSSGGG